MNNSSVKNMTRICLTLPSKVQSAGLWKQYLSNDPTSLNYHWLDFSLPRFELSIALIFAITQFFHYVLKGLGFPLLTSQLLAGLLLSPAILSKDVAESLMTDGNVQVLGTISTFGFSFYLFLMGVKMDPTMITRVCKRALYVGLLAVAAPLIAALLLLLSLGLEQNVRWKTIFISPAYSITTFPAVCSLLNDLRITNSELGRIGLSSAIVSDIFSVTFIVAGNLVRAAIKVGTREFIRHLFFVSVYLSFLFFVFRPSMKWVIRRTPEGKPLNPIFITIITLLFLFSICVNKWFNDYVVLAPYFLGLAVPHGPPLGSALVEKLESMVNNLLLPLFVTGCGMRVSTFNMFGKRNPLTTSNALIAVLVSVVKFVACLLPPLYSKMPKKDSLALACIMSCKGVLELGIFSFLFDNRVIDRDFYTYMFLVIIYLASIVPVLVKLLYDPSRKYAGYRKRNIMDSKSNSELQIVACIHVPDNVRSVINFLDVVCHKKDNPTSVNLLHLVKLRGQATPIFIAHQKKRTARTSTWCYSESVISSFNKFEGNKMGAVSIDTFTAVSSPSLMQDDICTLALDKLASLIILPFHRRWYIDGSIEAEDERIRILNTRVLERAPCSVGILIDRGNLRLQTQDTSTEPSFNVAMIFLGGADDREALTLGKSMSQDSRVCLTVIHFTNSNDEIVFEEWDKVVDSVALRDVKTNGYINYIEKEVNDGHETALIVRSIVNEFDLVIVGRRNNLESSPQTSGLKEWSEFPEIGILGDLLASKDCGGKCSVLVVQQQQIKQAS